MCLYLRLGLFMSRLSDPFFMIIFIFITIINRFATLTVVNDRQSVYGGLRGRNVRESAQNESSHKVIYIRG